MNIYEKNPLLEGLSLGESTEYRAAYDPALLQVVPRSLNRQGLQIDEGDSLPFFGGDVWHAYELSWLNSKGKPVVALARIYVSAKSPNIIESKSFKLYLNSLNQTRFESLDAVHKVLTSDLSVVADWPIQVELIRPDDINKFQVTQLPGLCIDDQDIEVTNFELEPELLEGKSKEGVLDEILHSHLLKSNCLITDQPDWASVIIRYTGERISHEALLRYLISFRLHNEFHEQCVERIFTDIVKFCKPERLFVQALYTRRGGLDINPYRMSHNDEDLLTCRINRQ